MTINNIMLTMILFYGALIFIVLRASGLLPAAFKLLAIIAALYAVALFSNAIHTAPACLHVPERLCY